MPQYPLFISDLKKSDRAHLATCVNRLLLDLECTQDRLRIYLEGEDPYANASVVKTIFDLNTTAATIGAMVDELRAKHGFPPGDMRQIGLTPSEAKKGLLSTRDKFDRIDSVLAEDSDNRKASLPKMKSSRVG